DPGAGRRDDAADGGVPPPPARGRVAVGRPRGGAGRGERRQLREPRGRSRVRRHGRGLNSAPMSVDPGVCFPGESKDYRRERNRLLEAEIELRRAVERVAAQRRTLPPGGVVPEDYRFEEAGAGGGEVRFSELFEPGKDTLVVYSFMFPRWSGDTRPGPAE